MVVAGVWGGVDVQVKSTEEENVLEVELWVI